MWSLARRFGVVLALAERRYAKEASKQLLGLFRREQLAHPELKGRALYEAVIARRLGSNQPINAATVVKRTEESFADWPVARDLKFRDVVHYQIFYEYMCQGDARLGTQTSFGETVGSIIPEAL